MSFNVELVANLVSQLKKAGFADSEVEKLSELDKLTEIKALLDGSVEITPKQHIIDCDVPPFIPAGWTCDPKDHIKGGKLLFDPEKTTFYLSEKQKDASWIDGNELRKELVGKLVLNANVLDYLLKNPQIIPESWKKDEKARTRYIYFWGTIYHDSYGSSFVRYLYFSYDSWDWGFSWFRNGFVGLEPALLGII